MKSYIIALVIILVGIGGFWYTRTHDDAYTTKPIHTIVVPGDISLVVGQSVTADDVTMTLNSIVADNRCPIDVRCIEAGAITTNVTFTTTDKTETKNMPSDEVPQKFGKRSISITGVTPPAQSTKQLTQSDYVVVFHFE